MEDERGCDRSEFHESVGAAHEAFDRMKRAFRRGTGCHLTAQMIDSLQVTIVGQMWEQEDPRDTQHPT